jgi:hypothetical protein
MAQLPLTNVITISVSQAQTGVGNYNTSNLAIFTDDVAAASFGTAGFASYLSPTQVGIDFGTTSKTFAMANAVFSQQPNILTGGGQLVIILLHAAVQTLAFSGVAASGVFVLNYSGNPTVNINWNDTAAQIQAKLQAVAGLGQVTVTGSIASQSLVVTMSGVYGAAALLSVTGDTLQTSGAVAVTVTPTTTTAGETIGAAITRTAGLVQYFGILANEALDVIGQTDLLVAAAVIQPLNKIGFFVSHVQADIAPGGMIDLIRTGTFTQTRGLYYGDTNDLNDIVFMASYAGRALSTNFSGSNTTQTMHLKALPGVQPDPTMTQTILNAALLAGADTYISLQGVSSVFCSGANTFFDRVYNLQWFVGALQVAGFNYLATASTKVPQTEAGMDGLKGAYRTVCEQGITNQYGAPGQWNSSTVFGNPADLIANVAQRGYYIYSTPIAQQSQTNRVARQAPLAQIAFKEAGAIQSSTVIVNVNA